jgi:ATP-binding cassette, subfamily B, bacterial
MAHSTPSTSSVPQPHQAKSTAWSEFTSIFTRFRETWAILGRKEKWILRLSLIPMLFHSVVENLISDLGGKLANALNTSQPASWTTIALQFIVLIGICSLARELLFLIRKRLVSLVCTRVDRNLTVGLVLHLYRQSLQSMSKDQIGTLHGRAIRGIRAFSSFVRVAFREFLPALLSILIPIGFAFYYSVWIGSLFVLAMLSSFALVIWQLNSQKGMYAELGKNQRILDGKMIEQLEGMEYIRAANTLDLEVGKIAKVADSRRDCDQQLWMRSSYFDIWKSLNEWVWYLGIMGATVYFASTNAIEIGKVITFLGLISNMQNPLREMHRILDIGYETSGDLKDLMRIMDELMDPSFDVDSEEEMTILIRIFDRNGEAPKIAFPKVDFKKPTIAKAVPLFETTDLVVEFGEGKDKRRILDDISIKIEHGETVGFAGPSGSGKSTLLKIMLRLIIKIASGKAKFGSVPIESVSRDAIGELIGYVSQNPFVFSGTVRENIVYGTKGEPSQQAIEEAARKAGIHDDIVGMPGGYDAMLRERGSNLSGGQRQRIAIARVFLKDPPILILDEGTSALDNVSEKVVQAALEKLRGNRTILLVAHRLTTLRSADRILVFEKGKIVQSGKMDELASTPGVFQDLMKVAEATGSP